MNTSSFCLVSSCLRSRYEVQFCFPWNWVSNFVDQCDIEQISFQNFEAIFWGFLSILCLERKGVRKNKQYVFISGKTHLNEWVVYEMSLINESVCPVTLDREKCYHRKKSITVSLVCVVHKVSSTNSINLQPWEWIPQDSMPKYYSLAH